MQSARHVPTSLRRHVRPNTPIKYGSAVLWELSYPIARAKSHRTNAEMAIKAYLAAADSGATSTLDNRTQATVSASLAATNATRIVIAHRLSTVRDADRNLMLERGRIVDDGTYEELLASKGAFYRLAQRQLL